MRIARRGIVPGLLAASLLSACGGGFSEQGEPRLAIQSETAGSVEDGSTIQVNVFSLDESDLADTLRLTNAGSAPLRIHRFETVGEQPGDAFELRPKEQPLPSEGNPVVIAPQGGDADGTDAPTTFEVDVALLTQEQSPTAELVIESNSAVNDRERVELRFEASDAAPELDAPESVDFGPVGQGETRTEPLNIVNKGNAPLRVTGFELRGHPSFDFIRGDQVWSPGGSDGDGATQARDPSQGIVEFDEPIEIGPGFSTGVETRFEPQGPESAQATLVLHSNDPEHPEGVPVQLRANQNAPCLEVQPEEVEFGGKLVGEAARVSVEVSSCGDAPLELQELGLVEDTASEFSLDLAELPGVEPPEDGSPVTSLGPDDPAVVLGNDSSVPKSASFDVIYEPDSKNEVGDDGQPVRDEGSVRIATNSFRGEQIVPVSGFGVNSPCPTAVIQIAEGEEVVPQTTLNLDGTQSYAPTGQIASYQWSVTQPAGSQSVFVPSETDPEPTFTANVAGTYTFQLEVVDTEGRTSCVVDEATVIVTPDQAIHAELLWNTPGDPDETDTGPQAGADMDLHFLHPLAEGRDIDEDGEPDGWFDTPFDCFWFNEEPNWGAQDASEDDPSLDRDDTDGAGPENVNLNVPQDGHTYEVGVHYWDDHGFGPSEATVRVYIHSEQVFEVSGVEMEDLDMWEVATVSWPSGEVRAIETEDGGRRITPDYTHPEFPTAGN